MSCVAHPHLGNQQPGGGGLDAHVYHVFASSVLRLYRSKKYHPVQVEFIESCCAVCAFQVLLQRVSDCPRSASILLELAIAELHASFLSLACCSSHGTVGEAFLPSFLPFFSHQHTMISLPLPTIACAVVCSEQIRPIHR